MGNIQNITVEPCNVTWGEGSDELDLGFLDGDIEVAPEEQGVDITAHQEGTNVLDMIRTGKSVELTLNLKETIGAAFDSILQAGGAESTPAAQVQRLTVLSATGINSKWFGPLYTASNALKGYVWFDVNNTGVDPAPAGYDFGISVELDATPTVAEIVDALVTAIDAHAGFAAVEDEADVSVLVTNAATGPAGDLDANVGDASANVSFEVVTQGIGTLTGWGKSKDFLGMVAHSKKLVLHPVALAANNFARDFCFWKAYPLFDSITISGENPRVMAVTFKVFPDATRQEAVRLFVVGDHR